jgi:acyl carrier protein
MVDKKGFLILMDELLELAPGTLTGDEILKDFELWDSVALISFMVMVKEHYNLIVSPKDVWACSNVNDLMTLAAKPPAA